MKKSMKKMIEAEINRQEKNPGKANREARKARRNAERGDLIPAPKTILDARSRSRKRAEIKKQTKREASAYL